MKGQWRDVTMIYDPVQRFIDRQLGGRWPLPVLAMHTSEAGQQTSTPSTPMYHEDQIIEVIDRKYSGGYKFLLLYQYLMVGYTQGEIARKMNVSLRTIERWVRKLKDDLRAYYELEGGYRHGKPRTKAEKRKAKKEKERGKKGI